MTPIAPHDDSPDDDEDTNGEEQVNPSRPVEPHTDGPDNEQRDTTENTEIHV